MMIMNSNSPSPKTLELLLKYEVGGGKAYYDKYLSKFTWPGGASGPTIAIGVDCGYYTETELAQIFSFISGDPLKLIQGASGKKGQSGKEYTVKLREAGIVVEWEKALNIFNKLTWPKFTRLAEKTFPELDKLHPDAYGAIVSLVFNRGTLLKGDSRKEMVKIKELIPKQNYKKIAQQFRDMKRIWIGKGLDGLLERRDAEANLVESCA
jgi:GH24 family phage-related lysozyme (muramidase)